MKNILIIAGASAFAIAVPYLAVGIAWICSFGAFGYQATVTSNDFYLFAIIYWVCFAWLIPAKAVCDY